MSLSDEWTEWHLTPNGWERGSTRVDFANITSKEPPRDRVLTCRYREILTSPFGKMDRLVTEEWIGADVTLKDQLVQTFGPCPKQL